jgi:hypothetical protein
MQNKYTAAEDYQKKIKSAHTKHANYLLLIS